MAFELISPVINGLIERTLLHDVAITRRLYGHSEARVVIDWDETALEGNKAALGQRATAMLGATMLDAEVTLKWRGDDLASNVECFKGYVTGVSARHAATRSYIALECVSLSHRADLIPRYRVWQSCTLLDICQHVAGAEPIFEVQADAQGVLGGISIDLSVQYEETDFAYLGRMLHAWGIPMYVDDRAGKIGIGSPKAKGSGAFPAFDWHYDAITLEGGLAPIDDKSRNAGSGATGTAKQYFNKFNASLKRGASVYLPRLDDDHLEEREWIAERVNDQAFQSQSAVYHIEWTGAVFDYSPGVGVTFANQSFLVRSSKIKGDDQSEAVYQELALQDYMAPVQMRHRRVMWPSRMFWATVTDNSGKDPTRQGRMQVAFDWEKLDPTVRGNERCWLPSVTPYGGLKGTSGTSGFLSLPEIGERVLVHFLGEWDSDAVIMGSVREYAREGYMYDPDQTKRWQTPSGNQVTLTTSKSGADTVRIKCQDKMVFEGKIDGGKETLIFDLFDSDTERIHFEKGSGPPRLDIFCGGEIYIHAEQKLLLEGGLVQIKSTTGPITIDGAPMVMINCGPWKLPPLKRAPDKGEEQTGQAKKRAKPPAWTAMVAAAAVASQTEKKTWIEIALKDTDGAAVAGERYRIKLPDGSTREGALDANGRARVDGIDPGTAQVCFPEIDADDWRPA